jgi:hypothetical protein
VGGEAAGAAGGNLSRVQVEAKQRPAPQAKVLLDFAALKA